MFTNRPALQKETPITDIQSQAKTTELEKEFILIRDAVQKSMLSTTDNEVEMDAEHLRAKIEGCFTQVLEEENIFYNVSTRSQMLDWVVADIIGYGPIEPLLKDPEITEVMVNGYEKVFVERFGLIEKTSVRFEDDAHLMRVINRIVNPIGRRVDESSPMVDARLPNGNRVNATIPPLSPPPITVTSASRFSTVDTSM